MQTYIDKAAVLIEALPYIQKLKGKKIVIKYGGSVIAEERYCESIMRDVVFMRTVGMHPIIVHGGGKAISQRLKEAQIPSEFHHGLRVTSKDAINIIREVLTEEMSTHICDLIEKFGGQGKRFNGFHGKCIHCNKKTEHLGALVDLGYVGEVSHIDTKIIEEACDEGLVPVIAPIGIDDKGEYYNINADTMAGELAASIHAQKMVYLSDIPGILKDMNDPSTLYSSLQQSQVQGLIDNGTIQGGMIPKIQASLKSLEAGSKKTHIIDGRLQHSLLLEIFTDKGVGTEIVHG